MIFFATKSKIILLYEMICVSLQSEKTILEFADSRLVKWGENRKPIL